MNKKLRFSTGLAMLVLGIVVFIGSKQASQTTINVKIDLPSVGLFERERQDGGYFTIVDEEGRVISKTSRMVYPEDEIITEDDKLYRVERVSGDTAYARYIRDAEMPVVDADGTMPVTGETVPVQQNNARNLIAIYQTHNDESYVPTDGTETIQGKGGVVDVGKAFADQLQRMGIDVAWSDAGHLPHDQNAYKRSRRTAFKLLKKQPTAIFDVHRDGVPDPDYYRAQVGGQKVTRLRLVVGRQNQNMQSNLDFAKRIKAQINKKYPGLIREIFLAKGNYNQDLAPRSLLIEVGTHTNDKHKAINGVQLFADVLPEVLGIGTGPSKAGPGPNNAGQSPNNPPSTGGDWSSILWILAALLVGGGIFLLISTGSWQKSWEKLKQFGSGQEWANFFGRARKEEKYQKGNMLESQINEENFRIEEVENKLVDTNDERAEYQKD